MIIKNAGKLSKSYFKSYMNLVMNAREMTLEEAKSFSFEELFHNDKDTYGRSTYLEFEEAYSEMKESE